MAGVRKSGRVQSVSRALGILEAVALKPNGIGLGALAREVGLPAQTVQGLVRTLQHHRYVVQNERGGPYCLGPAMPELWQTWSDRQDRGELAASVVEACCTKLGENVVLAELQGGVLVPLAQSMARGELSVKRTVPDRETIHLRATGRILLASLEKRTLAAVLLHADFKSGGPRAPRSAGDLLSELPGIRTAGVACVRDVAAAGISAVAVAIADRTGHVAAALGCNLPTARLNKTRERSLVAGLRLAGKQVAAAWGW